jgi:multimeric flavodoxin WrbA
MSKGKKNLVILGSSRSDSNTLKAVRERSGGAEYELVELHRLHIQPYDYDHASLQDDDFLPVVKKMVDADAITFASPVYWYAMSGTMKTFMDRFSELLSTHKTLGRSLKGKDVYLVSSGSSPELPEGFVVPFQKTAEYFDMSFREAFYQQACYEKA